jgi:Trk-type K+ transport system membrane component
MVNAPTEKVLSTYLISFIGGAAGATEGSAAAVTAATEFAGRSSKGRDDENRVERPSSLRKPHSSRILRSR